MKNTLFNTFALSAVLMTSACTTMGPNNSIDVEARQLINSLDGKVHIPQSEFLVDIHMSTAGANAAMAAGAVPGIGILLAAAAGGAGAAVDAKVNATRQETAEGAIVPIKNQLIGYDFSSVVYTKLSSELKKIDWLNANSLQLDRSSNVLPETLEENYGSSSSDAYMSVSLDYAITADLTHIEIDALAQIFPKTTELNAFKHTPEQKDQSLEKNTEIGDTLFYRAFKVTVPLPDMVDIDVADQDAIKEKLAGLERSALIEKLEQAADTLAADMSAAINNPDLPNPTNAQPI